MATYQIANLLEKMTSNDKDFRFMATNDLMTELQKDSIKLDDESEKKVVRMVLRLLEDKNGEVQNLAVKCLGPLVNKVKENQVETIVDLLCLHMVSNNEQLRDISSIGLKTVISELPQIPNTLAPNIVGKLSSAIAKSDVSVQLEALDILSDLLSRFGEPLIPFHETILEALMPQLDSQRQAVRKRTIVALSHLLTTCDTSSYNKVIDELSNGLKTPKDSGTIRTYIQCLASICRQSGHRLCNHIDSIMPFITLYSQQDDDELREFCLQACEAFVQKCPEAIKPHIESIISLCVKYIKYDPNYNYEADDSDMGTSMDTEEEEDVDSEEYSDDDDMSWKVRRAAAKCLESVISTRPDMLEEFYLTLSPVLFSRFKEREENVKSDIFHAYIALLKVTPTKDDIPFELSLKQQHPTPINLLDAQVPKIVDAIQPLLRLKSVKTRQDCFLLLRELLRVYPGGLQFDMYKLMPGIQYALSDKNSTSNMKIDTLQFVHCLFQSHSPRTLHTYVEPLVPLIVNAVFDPFYKIAIEALIVVQQLAKVIRPLEIDDYTFEFHVFIPPLYNCTLKKLQSPEVDQEVKERAIACMGQIIANMGEYLRPEMVECLPLFMDRLKNEVSRLSAVKALTMIAASPLRIDLSPILDDIILYLGKFLRKNQRVLKLHTLILLKTMVKNYFPIMDRKLLSAALFELQPLISESDLHVAQLSLDLLATTASKQRDTMDDIREKILPEIMNLVRSPLLQGKALTCMLKFFRSLVYANLPELGVRAILDMLMGPVANQEPGQPLHKQAYHSLAKCVAAVTLQVPSEALPVATELLHTIQKPCINSHLIFYLLTIGEIGRHFDLSSIESLPEWILNCFTASSEDIKGAASHSLGAVAVGSLNYFLPFILNEIEAQPKKQYLLLHSLKEVISSLSTTQNGLNQLLPSLNSIWAKLFNYCECSEEGSRNVVAECLGKLVLVKPDELLPNLQQALQSESPLMRTAVVSAIKYTISDQPQPIDKLLRQCIGQFLLLQDPEPTVRRVALVTFNSAVHNKPSLVRDLLPELLPQLYSETKVKKALIREVEMGPFKHTVDDGLDIRKAAFECMYTLLDWIGLDRVDIMQFLEHVQAGLSDHYDIKMLTYLMTARLAILCPNAVLQKLDDFVDPLQTTCTLKVKANSVKQEYEKQDELKRSALRAVAALSLIPKSLDKNKKLFEFLSLISKTPELQLLYESVQKDTNINSNLDIMMEC